MKPPLFSRRLFVPLVVLGSLLWVALIVASGALDSDLPQSMGCADPATVPFSLLRARPDPCQAGAPINPSLPRRTRHDNRHEDHAPL